MPNGFKQTKLSPELQREMEKFEREMKEIQRQIDEKKGERVRLESQIKTEKEIILKGGLQKRKEISNLEKEIRRLDEEIKKTSEKYLSQIRSLDSEIGELNKMLERATRQNEEFRRVAQEKPETETNEKYLSQIRSLDNQIGELNKMLERATGQSEEFRRVAQEKPETETKIVEDLMRQKNQLQFEIRELENKLQDRKNKLDELDSEIQRAAKKAPLPKGIITTEPQLKLKRAERDKLMEDREKIQTAINNLADNLSREKLKAAQEKERLEEELKSQVSSPQLQKLENELKELTLDTQRLEHRKLEAERGLSSIRSRMKSMPPVR